MGLWPWGFGNMLGPKFIKLVKKDGFIRTYQRAHKAVRDNQHLGGLVDAVQCVGQDQFGNRYYEDFTVASKEPRANDRRLEPQMGRVRRPLPDLDSFD